MTLKSVRVEPPVLIAPVGYAEISGFVENREERERSDRFLLRVHRFDAARTEAKPDRVRLSVRKGTAPAVTIKEWLAADGDARAPRDESLAEHIRCDSEGCVATMPDRSLVALSLSLDALAEDCGKAALVVTARAGLADCTALLIDRDELRASGALDITRAGKTFEILRANPRGQDRPWARQTRPVARAAQAPALPDATPRSEDLEATNPDQ